MLILPRNLASLVKAAAPDTGRYALSAIHLQDKGNRAYVAEATDGRILCRIAGTGDNPDDFPAPAAVAAAPNSATDTLIPADDWTRAFSAIPKPRKRGPVPVLATAAVLGERLTTFAAVNAGTVAVTEAERPGTGTTPGDWQPARYPQTDQVFPSKPPVAVVCLDPVLLQRVLDIAETVTNDTERRITLEIRDSETPVLIRASNADAAQEFTGLIMPLTLDKKHRPRDIAKDLSEAEQTIERLRDSKTMYEEECKRLEAANAELRQQLADLQPAAVTEADDCEQWTE